MSSGILRTPLTAMARTCALHPWLVMALAALVLVGASLALTRLRISSSLEAMFGLNTPAAKAMHRVTTEFQAGEALLVIVEPKAPGPIDRATREGLVAFADDFVARLQTDPRTRHMVAWARCRQDPAMERYVREVVLPQGAYFLGPQVTARLIEKLAPERLAQQFARNESLITAPGAAGGALSGTLLRDPLRLFELLDPRFATDVAGSMLVGVQKGDAPQPDPELSTDGRAILIRIAANASLNDLDAATVLTRDVAELVETLAPATLRVGIGGPFAISAASSRTMRADAIVSTLVSVGLLYGLFVVFYRR
jgi:hypothetical protein